MFRTDTHDLIQYDRGVDLVYRPVNIDRAYRQGMEFSLKLNPKNNVSMDLNYIWQKSKNKKTGDELTYTPRHKGKINCKFTFETDTKLEVIFRMMSRQYSDPENSDSGELDAYSCVDLKVTHPVFLKSQPADIFVHFQNLFDTDFEVHHGYPDDGFRFICGLNLNF